MNRKSLNRAIGLAMTAHRKGNPRALRALRRLNHSRACLDAGMIGPARIAAFFAAIALRHGV